MEIEQGHYGDVKLDGLRMGGIYQWPGAVHEGRGKCQPFVDERADAKQREALIKIMTGQDTAPDGDHVRRLLLDAGEGLRSDLRADRLRGGRGARTRAIQCPGLIESHGEPIKNPVTGAETRARIDLPDGFEYEIAEIGSGTTKTQGNVDPRSEGQLWTVRPPASQQPRRDTAPHGVTCRPKTRR